MASKPEVTFQNLESTIEKCAELAIKKYRLSVSRFKRKVKGLDSADFLQDALYEAHLYEERVRNAKNKAYRVIDALKKPDREKYHKIHTKLSEKERTCVSKLNEIESQQEALARLEIANLELPVGAFFIELDDILDDILPKEKIETAKNKITGELIKYNEMIFASLGEYVLGALEKKDSNSYFTALKLVDLLNFGYEGDYELDNLEKIVLPYGREVLRLGSKIQNAVEDAKKPETKMKRIGKLLPERLTPSQLLSLIASSSSNPP